MRIVVLAGIEIGLLFLLLFKDKNDGEKDLFRKQNWSVTNILITVLITNFSACVLLVLQATDYIVVIKRNISLFTLIVFLSFLLLFRIKFKQNAKTLGFNGIRFEKIALWVLCIVPVLISIFLNIAPLITITSGIVFRMGNITTSISLNQLISIFDWFFTAIALGPIMEESMYRGVVYSPFRKKFGPKAAILIDSLLFGVLHTNNPVQACLKSLLLCWVFEKTQSLYWCVLIHIALNAIVFTYSFKEMVKLAIN
jgi:uncharacterized protein